MHAKCGELIRVLQIIFKKLNIRHPSFIVFKKNQEIFFERHRFICHDYNTTVVRLLSASSQPTEIRQTRFDERVYKLRIIVIITYKKRIQDDYGQVTERNNVYFSTIFYTCSFFTFLS